jgi:uncharacterized ubiquitin-like protein YukD
MITITVFTIAGKSQDFPVSPHKPIREIKTQIVRNHKYFIGPNSEDKEVKLLYKGIELDESKCMENYNIADKSTIQIINKTKPVSIRRVSESMPNNYHTSIFESYAPSPLDSGFDGMNRLSKSSSPNVNYIDLMDQNQNIMKYLGNITNQLDNVITRLQFLESKVENLAQSIPKK